MEGGLKEGKNEALRGYSRGRVRDNEALNQIRGKEDGHAGRTMQWPTQDSETGCGRHRRRGQSPRFLVSK